MKDERKFKLLAALALALCVLALAYNLAAEYVMPDIEGYLSRRMYYEQTISKKGLSMKKALYWREEGTSGKND